MKYTNLCTKHIRLWCPACISSSGQHSDCNVFLFLDNYIKTAKASTLFQSVEESLNNLKINLQMIVDDRRTNVIEIHDQQKKIKKEVNNVQEKIIGHLMNLERHILEELNKKVEQSIIQLQSEKEKLEKSLERLEKDIRETNTLKQCTSDLQTYLGFKAMKAKVARETNLLQSIVSDGYLKRLAIRLNVDKKITDIFRTFPCLDLFRTILNSCPLS